MSRRHEQDSKKRRKPDDFGDSENQQTGRKLNRWQVMKAAGFKPTTAKKKRELRALMPPEKTAKVAPSMSALLSHIPAVGGEIMRLLGHRGNASAQPASRLFVEADRKNRAYWNGLLKQAVTNPAVCPRDVFFSKPDLRAKQVASDAVGKAFVDNWLRQRLAVFYRVPARDIVLPKVFLSKLYQEKTLIAMQKLLQRVLSKVLQFPELIGGYVGMSDVYDNANDYQCMIAWALLQPAVAGLVKSGWIERSYLTECDHQELLAMATKASSPRVRPYLCRGDDASQNCLRFDDVFQYGQEQISHAIEAYEWVKAHEPEFLGEITLNQCFMADEVKLKALPVLLQHATVRPWLLKKAITVREVLLLGHDNSLHFVEELRHKTMVAGIAQYVESGWLSLQSFRTMTLLELRKFSDIMQKVVAVDALPKSIQLQALAGDGSSDAASKRDSLVFDLVKKKLSYVVDHPILMERLQSFTGLVQEEFDLQQLNRAMAVLIEVGMKNGPVYYFAALDESENDGDELYDDGCYWAYTIAHPSIYEALEKYGNGDVYEPDDILRLTYMAALNVAEVVLNERLTSCCQSGEVSAVNIVFYGSDRILAMADLKNNTDVAFALNHGVCSFEDCLALGCEKTLAQARELRLKVESPSVAACLNFGAMQYHSLRRMTRENAANTAREYLAFIAEEDTNLCLHYGVFQHEELTSYPSLGESRRHTQAIAARLKDPRVVRLVEKDLLDVAVLRAWSDGDLEHNIQAMMRTIGVDEPVAPVEAAAASASLVVR